MYVTPNSAPGLVHRLGAGAPGLARIKYLRIGERTWRNVVISEITEMTYVPWPASLIFGAMIHDIRYIEICILAFRFSRQNSVNDQTTACAIFTVRSAMREPVKYFVEGNGIEIW